MNNERLKHLLERISPPALTREEYEAKWGFDAESVAEHRRQFPELNDCPDMECMQCAVSVCPHREPLHFHHDGCPACVFEEET